MQSVSQTIDPGEIHALLTKALGHFLGGPRHRISLAPAAWTAWIYIACMYNTTLPFTAARTLISCIHGFLKGEAGTGPPDHPRSIPGWHSINGPYVMRGDLPA
jgi:hypothetical protein